MDGLLVLTVFDSGHIIEALEALTVFDSGHIIEALEAPGVKILDFERLISDP